jgi:hypothetical protein
LHAGKLQRIHVRGVYTSIYKIVNLLQPPKNMLTHPTKEDKTNRITEMYSKKRPKEI